ncbi:MAG TPA: hypothetical protein VGB55_03450 [Tepidisphaeraceae bacterium]|jgi:hypothetical protein
MFSTLMKLTAVVLLGVGPAGCQSDGMAGAKSDSGMMTVVTADGSDTMMAAPMDGTYTLHSSTSGGMRPMFTAQLKKGEMIGFKTTADGKMMAMAGEKFHDVSGMKGVSWQHGMVK